MAKQRHVGPGTWNPGEDEIIHIENKEKVRTNSRSITMRTGTPDLYSPPRVVMCLFVSFLQELVYPSGLGSPDGPDTHNAEEKREGTFLEIFFEFSLSPLAQRISREPTGEIRNADPRDQQPSQPYAGRVIGGGGGSSFCRIECTPPPTTHQLRACLYKGELNPTELN